MPVLIALCAPAVPARAQAPAKLMDFKHELGMKLAQGNRIFYFTNDKDLGAFKPWVTDGTPQGTMMLTAPADSTDFTYASDMVANSLGQACFLNNFNTLWVSGGTPASTHAYPITGSFSGTYPLNANWPNLLTMGVHAYYVTDAGLVSVNTMSGATVLLKANLPSWEGKPNGIPAWHGSLMRLLGRANGRIFFRFYVVSGFLMDSASVWSTDGTTSGTQQVATIEDTDIRPVGTAGNDFYFLFADDWGLDLWRSDGTPAGTAKLKHIERVGPLDDVKPDTTATIRIGGTTFFVLVDSDSDWSTWFVKTDGTTTGTLALNGKLYSIIHDSNWNFSYLGYYDPAGASTQVTQFSPPITPGSFQTNGKRMLIQATDGFWGSDGTAGGSAIVFQLNSGIGRFLASPNCLWLAATANGDLYRTDATPAGTHYIGNLGPKADFWVGGPIFNFCGTKLVYCQSNPRTQKVELWSIPNPLLSNSTSRDWTRYP